MDLQRPRGINGRQAVRLLERPTIDKTIVARRTFEIQPQQRLADALCELYLHRLSGADFAAPSDAVDEAAAFVGWRSNQFPRELIVGLIRQQRVVQPAADLFSAAIDEARAGVIVPQ